MFFPGTSCSCSPTLPLSSDTLLLPCASVLIPQSQSPCWRNSTDNAGQDPCSKGVNYHHTTRMARALATGPDVQSSQIGKQALEVEGGQRGLCLLRRLLQTVKGRKSAGQPDVETGGAKRLGSSELPSVPSPQRPLCLPPHSHLSGLGGHLQELELNSSWLPGVLRAG